MAHILKFLSTDKTALRLLLRSALLGATLFLVWKFNFHLLAIAFSFFIFLGIYFSEIKERKFLRFSFWLLAVSGLVGLKLLSSSLLFSSLSLLLVAALFFVLLGLINFFFKNKNIVYGVFNTLLFLISFLIIFYLSNPGNFWIFAIIAFFLVIFIFREAFGFLGVPKSRKNLTVYAALALLGVEFAWIVNFLPLGFINAAIFLTLFFLLMRDVLVAKAKGILSFSFVFRQLTFFIIFTIIILAASRWTI